jgi:hydroxymethylglutaryl-CoA lyase
VLIGEVGPRDLANGLAAHDVGVRGFDASLGVPGGCPFALGASGNGVSEDPVLMSGPMGVHTGVDPQRLIEVRPAPAGGDGPHP